MTLIALGRNILPKISALILLTGASAVVVHAETPFGIVVETVAKGGGAAAAGMAPGDILLSWEGRAPDGRVVRGELQSPVGLLWIEREFGPVGPITFMGRRGEEAIAFTIKSSGSWKLESRPMFSAEAQDAYQRGKDLLAGADAKEGLRLWQELSRGVDDWRQAAWLLLKLGQARADQKEWGEAHQALTAAVGRAEGMPEQLALLYAHGKILEREPAVDKAADLYRQGLERSRRPPTAGLMEAVFLTELAHLAYYRSDYDEAVRLYREVLGLRERLAPGSWVVAASLNNLANPQAELGDHAAAESAYEQAVAIQQRLTTDGSGLTQEGSVLAMYLGNLAIEVRIRGDLARAQALLERALAMERRHAPSEGSQTLANILYGLGHVSYGQRDLERTQQLYEEALAVQERLTPGGPAVASRQNALGVVANERGDFDAAEGYFKRSLEHAQKLSPEGQEVILTLINLGTLERKRGRLPQAEQLLREALRLQDARAPGDRHAATALDNLGDVLLDTGRLDDAAATYRRALDIRRRLSPGSAPEAAALARLGRCVRRQGDRDEAIRLHLDALRVLDEQSSKLGGGEEARLAFGRDFDRIYRDAIALLVDQGRLDEALHVLERSRARSFLALLAERDLLDADIPVELDQKRRRLDAEYDRTQARLARLDAAKDAERIATLTRELREVRAKQTDVAGEIRRASPRFAALRSPHALDIGGARAALDPGTVLLSYAVGEERTDLFAVSREDPGLRHFVIPLGRKAMAERVRAFREAIARSLGTDPSLDRQARELYHAVLRPAEDVLVDAQRIVVCPDGPLHTLPFAALRRGRQYVVEWKPVHTTVSATVYAELRKAREGASPRGPMVAFGDPRYPLPASTDGEAVRDATLRDGLRRGLNLTALPASRREAESIARLYGRDARLFLGGEATEERAKSEARGARYVHFACHGFLDERMPLNSGLALTTRVEPKEGEDNGLLQAWEVFERVRLDADLVTLSACDTGLGKEMGGEGLVGLTRAFQYAGARSVVASLWPAPDRSTADLMRAFYVGLRRGLAKDEALRQAQLTLIRSGAARSHPFRWAGFQLFGDWK